MKAWAVQDAKAKFSELLDASIEKGPQLVTRRGVEAAVLVSAVEWRRIQQSARPTLKELLLWDDARVDLPIPERGRARRRSNTFAAH
jgi:prevent-host-death family protein